MAKKRKKNLKRNIYIWVAVAVVLLGGALVIEKTGLGAALKTQVATGGGVCYTNAGVCIPPGPNVTCSDGKPDNYKYVDYSTIKCPANYKVFQAKTTFDVLSAKTSEDAAAQCKRDLQAQAQEAENNVVCNPGEEFSFTVSPTITKLYDQNQQHVANCMAVATCARISACYNSSTTPCVSGKTEQGCQQIADKFTIFRAGETCVTPSQRLTHTATQGLNAPPVGSLAESRILNNTKAKCDGELRGFIANNKLPGSTASICAGSTRPTMVFGVDFKGTSKTPSYFGITDFSADCAAVVRCN